MPSTSSPSPCIVVLGSGGTIAGAAASALDNVGYQAGQVGVAQLLAAVPALASHAIEAEQVAQIDSSDMHDALWQRLAQRAAHHLARPEVKGLVLTHGTDTLEETAWFLQRVLAPAKPLVLTAAMRPATSLAADGPQNLLDAVRLAEWPGARGVLVALAGRVFGAAEVQKLHSYRTDTFSAPDMGPLARMVEGEVQPLRPWPEGTPQGVLGDLPWPWVELLTNHAGADARAVQALAAAGVRGLVIAGTGSGSVHEAWRAALADAEGAGVRVALASRCPGGPVLSARRPASWRVYPGLNAVKTRIELMLELMNDSAALKPPSA